MTREELRDAIREHALLEGDFLLRSGKRSPYYLDKYRFETRPELLGPLGRLLAEQARQADPDIRVLAGPELGAVALAASASLASGLPFLIVRGAAKGYGTANRIEGAAEAGARVVLVEDVVTSGGAACEAVEALREAGYEVRAAVCVVDREEGGVDGLARRAVRLWPLFRASEIVKTPANPLG
jgi:orotate phosphoribosyltransferase